MELELLKKFFENKCSPDEVEQVFDWIEGSDSIRDLDKDFQLEWEKIKVKSGDYQKWGEQLENIHEKIKMEDLYGTLNLETPTGKKLKDRSSKSRVEILDFQRKDRKRHFIPLMVFSLIIAMVVIGYFNFPVPDEPTVAIKEISKSTELGQKLSFHLEDGTKVILNAGSKLSYLSEFGAEERTVKLEGEAFFEVSKDTNRPFHVITESVVTTALGTSFNINAFPGNENIEIALVTGKVSVQNTNDTQRADLLFLDPGEMATVTKNNHSMLKTSFDFNVEVSWKDGIIYFKDANYQEIINKLERWYGVRIHSNPVPFTEWSFSGIFQNETLENLLEALQYGHKFDYVINGNEIELTF